MKKILLSFLIASLLILAGCFHNAAPAQEESGTANGKSAQKSEKQIEALPPETIEEVTEAEQSGNIQNCKKLKEEYLQKQCEYNIRQNQEEQKSNAR